MDSLISQIPPSGPRQSAHIYMHALPYDVTPDGQFLEAARFTYKGRHANTELNSGLAWTVERDWRSARDEIQVNVQISRVADS